MPHTPKVSWQTATGVLHTGAVVHVLNGAGLLTVTEPHSGSTVPLPPIPVDSITCRRERVVVDGGRMVQSGEILSGVDVSEITLQSLQCPTHPKLLKHV